MRRGILIGIFLLGYPVGALIDRAKTRDDERADRKAEEVAAAVVAHAEADRSRFIRGATSPDFEGRRVFVEEPHLTSATGTASAPPQRPIKWRWGEPRGA